MRVAIVDDDYETVDIIRDFLARNDVDSEGFTEAETLFGRGADRFDAVILDIQLPGMWGSECGYALRKRGYKGPIIGITGNVEGWDADDLRDLGFTCLLGKPLDPYALLDRVRESVPQRS